MEQDDHSAKMASTTTSTSSDGAETMTDTDMDMDEADMTQWTEKEFEEKRIYIVKDTALEAGPDSDATTTTRAEASLPRNLVFKHLAGSKEVRQEHFPSSRRFSQNVQAEKAVCMRGDESDVGHAVINSRRGGGCVL